MIKNYKTYKGTIFHYSESLDPTFGGPSVSVPEFAKKLGFRHKFISKDASHSNNQVITACWKKLDNKIKAIQFLIKHLFTIKKNDILVIHCIWDPFILLLIIPFVLNRAKILVYVRGSLKVNKFKKRIFYHLVFKWVLFYSSLIIFSCRAQLEKELNSNYQKKSIILPNVVSIKNASIQVSDNQIGYLGRIHPHKRIEYMIDIVSSLKGTTLKLAGP